MYGAVGPRNHRRHTPDADSSPVSKMSPRSSPSFDLGPTEDDDHGGEFQHQPDDDHKSTWYLILLTVATGGLQIVWSVEFSSVSPFLLSLGLSKALMALVWIAGPLSGSLVQPYVGIKSDNCRIPWGRRRPFMVGGALATCVSLMLLCWTREIVGTLCSIFGAGPDSTVTVTLQQMFAVVLVYLLDFAVNVIQAGIRAFIVDCAPAHQQEAANAWASRISGVGNIVGYLAGFVHLPSLLPFLGHTQFQVLCALAVCIILGTLTVSCTSVSERDPRTFGPPSQGSSSVLGFFRTLVESVRRLPPQIHRVCQVQLFAWIGWFPFLFYITSYIGQIYANPFFEANPNMTKEEVEAVFEDGTRMGAFAMLVFAFTTFGTSVLVPLLIIPAYAAPAASAPGRIEGLLMRMRVPGLTLRRTWMLSHLVFFVLCWATLLVRGTTLATVIVALVGIPWAITNWAPFALIAAEISARDAQRRRHAATDEDEAVDQAGIVLGIHNVSIAAPQVVATVASSFVFQMLQKPRGQPGDDSIGWVLRLGGIAALGAAIWCRRVADGPSGGQGSQGYEQVGGEHGADEA